MTARPAGGPSLPQSLPFVEAAKNAAAEPAAREPASCGFGAVRVGALLGRLRLHLQTERFLAVHRHDEVWEAGCLQAALVLAEVVAAMAEGEMDAPLAPPHMQERRALVGLPIAPGVETWGGVGQDSGRTRKTGTVTLARCCAELEGSAR